MKILFFINALEHGGAARVTATISNELAKRGHSVSIIANTIHQKVNYKIQNDVTLVPLVLENYYNYPRIIRRILICCNIRRNLKIIKPDIIVAMMHRNYLLVQTCSLGLSIPVIASDRNCLYRSSNRFDRFIRFHIYPFAAAVTVLTQCDYDFLGKKLPKKVVMYNTVEFNILDKETTRKKNILAVGRLDAWDHKGFDTLIEVWARIAKKYSDWTLEIIGDGSEKNITMLKNLTIQHGIENNVTFFGFRTDMDVVYQTSSIFVLSSRYEGLGNVLIEAMSQGCACIAFEMDGRPNEFITSPNRGIIVKDQDKDELEKAIIRLIEDESLRKSLGENAKKEMARFSKDEITDQWESLFKKVLKKMNMI